jgi:hypothetical protein
MRVIVQQLLSHYDNDPTHRRVEVFNLDLPLKFCIFFTK